MSLADDAVVKVGGAQAIRRAVEVLRIVAMTQRAGATAANISKATGLNRSTAFRIAQSLCEEGLLDYDPVAHTYCVGQLAYEIGLAARDRSQIVGPWQDRLRAIRDGTGMTTYLGVRSDLDIVCLAVLQGSGRLRAVPFEVGERAPLGIGSSSLAILASLEDAEVALIVEANQSRAAAYGGADLTVAAVGARVAATRAKGYACNKNATNSGMVSIGMGVASATRLTRVAISVTRPGDGMSAEEEAAAVAVMRDVLGAEVLTP